VDWDYEADLFWHRAILDIFKRRGRREGRGRGGREVFIIIDGCYD
jgi:hypothetical protein